MIIFLYGEDEFRSSRKLAEIKSKFMEKNNPAGAGFVFDFQEKKIPPRDIMLDLSSGCLFSNKKMAVFKNSLSNKEFADDQEFLNFLEKEEKNAKNMAMVFWEVGKFEKKSKLAKFLLAHARAQEFRFLEGGKLASWIRENISEKSAGKASLSETAARKLAAFVGSENLSLLDKEMEKLVGYKNQGEIRDEDVELLAKSKISTDVFKTIDALATGDKKTAVKLLHNHLSAGDDPFYLLSMYFFQFRNLLKVKPLAQKHISERDIASKLKLHPFVAKKSLMQGRNFSLAKLKEIYKKLCDIDYGAKTGRIEIGLALDKFISCV